MKVIIVEDSKIIREKIIQLPSMRLVKILGFTEDYKETIDLINENTPDVIILDLILSTSSGIEVLKYIRSNNISCKIIVLTNHNIPVIRAYCLKLGADYFFDKAHEFNKVDEVLKGWMTLKQ